MEKSNTFKLRYRASFYPNLVSLVSFARNYHIWNKNARLKTVIDCENWNLNKFERTDTSRHSNNNLYSQCRNLYDYFHIQFLPKKMR
jgi:hypothetical protein